MIIEGIFSRVPDADDLRVPRLPGASAAPNLT